MNKEIKIIPKIVVESPNFDVKGERYTKELIIEYDTFPQSNKKEQLLIIQSKFVSLSLYTEIVVKNDLAAKTHFAQEINHQIRTSPMRSGMKCYFTSKEDMTLIADDIIKIFTDFKWITKQHLTIIFEKGFSGQLTDYKTYCLSNFIGWANAYYDKIKPVLMKQLQYEKGKQNQPIPELTKEQNEERKANLLLNQLRMLKCILRNPFAYIEKDEESELKEYFKQALKVFWGRNGYSLEFAFDYLLEKGVIKPKEGEIDGYFEKDTISGLEKLDIPDRIKNIHKLIGAKNEYMSRLILELIEDETNLEFVDKF